MSAPLDPVPQTATLVDTNGVINGIWFRWFYAIWARVRALVQVVGTAVHLTAQAASIGSTTAYTAAQNGVYRVSWYARVTTPDGVSSSVAVTIGWREGGHTCSKTFAALTGDSVMTADGNSIPVRVDSGTNITYATTYASNTPNAMQYALDVVVELVNS